MPFKASNMQEKTACQEQEITSPHLKGTEWTCARTAPGHIFITCEVPIMSQRNPFAFWLNGNGYSSGS